MDFLNEICCPQDKELHKELLINTKDEYKYLEKYSKEIKKIVSILDNKHRLQILLIISKRKLCTEEILKILNVKRPAISYHIKILIREGLISKERRSIYVYYSITEYGKNLLMGLKNIKEKYSNTVDAENRGWKNGRSYY